MPEKQYFTGIDIINAPRIESLTVTEDGTYTASSDVIGYNPVVVNTNQPWQPLEDGYSNFWFELTNDTLSPWLNFSAKNNDATIDWGDGSGEVALDTLTPTHTYAKAGKYVVKVKGVTGITAQNPSPYRGSYLQVLKYVECAEELDSMTNNTFMYCSGLKRIILSQSLRTLASSGIRNCTSLERLDLPNITAIEAYALSGVYCITSLTIPASVTSLGNYAINTDISLSEIHVLATTPPTLATSSINSIASNYVIYVPVGTGETYKAAAGWSAYADHILEEGQTPNRAMLSRLAKAADTDTDNEEMR